MAERFFGEHFPVPNEISYTASGTATQVNRLELVAETYNYDPAIDRQTLDRATVFATSLLRTVFGRSAPIEAATAVSRGADGEWTVDNCTVLVERMENLPGRGFSVALYIMVAR